jgi:uncharacterized membrane protein
MSRLCKPRVGQPSRAKPSTAATASLGQWKWLRSMVEEAKRRGAKFQLRLADAITSFAGSMNFVWIHAVLFAVWMVVLEKTPWPTLTLVVSLEAIFLSTFVMIGQNRKAGECR